MSKQLNQLQLMIEQHVAKPLPENIPDIAVRQGPLETVEAVRLAMDQCEDVTVKQHLVSACRDFCCTNESDFQQSIHCLVIAWCDHCSMWPFYNFILYQLSSLNLDCLTLGCNLQALSVKATHCLQLHFFTQQVYCTLNCKYALWGVASYWQGRI